MAVLTHLVASIVLGLLLSHAVPTAAMPLTHAQCPAKCVDEAMAKVQCMTPYAISGCMISRHNCPPGQAACMSIADVKFSPSPRPYESHMPESPRPSPSISPYETNMPESPPPSPTPSETPLPSESSTPMPSMSMTPLPSRSPMPSMSMTPRPSRSPVPSKRPLPSEGDGYTLLWPKEEQKLRCMPGTTAAMLRAGPSCRGLEPTYSLYVGTRDAMHEHMGCFVRDFEGVSCMRLCGAEGDERTLTVTVDFRATNGNDKECADELVTRVGRAINAFSSKHTTCFTRDFDRADGGTFITKDLKNAMQTIVLDTLCEAV